MTARTSPLDAAHRALGARMVPFGGWEMPLAYPMGTLREHLACRQRAVVFDVSHLGTVRVRGGDAFALLQRTLTNDLGRIGPGRAQYTHLLDPSDAGVLDDIIVWWVAGGPGEADSWFDVMPNASNTSRVLEALEGPGVDARDATSERGILAVQGPASRSLLASVTPAAAAVPRFGVCGFKWRGADCLAAGTGYTGEEGVEISAPPDQVASLWEALLDAGIAPAGLGARDTLRLEAGLPLHGHELGPGITPLQAGLGWVVSWAKTEFRGRDALAAERERGPARVLRGLRVEGRQPPREGCAINLGGEAVGVVTSGNFSPVLGVGIALGFLPPGLPEGLEVTVDVRGRLLPARIAALPFVRRAPARVAVPGPERPETE
ncbi:MAG: glycine cleavage system aminomethyltransferase GcvT [Acidimicrobiales bacterium]